MNNWLKELQAVAESARKCEDTSLQKLYMDCLRDLIRAEQILALIDCAEALEDLYSIAVDNDPSCATCTHSKCTERREIFQCVKNALAKLREEP